MLQINTTLNTGSVGRIAEQIGETIQREGSTSYIAYSRRSPRAAPSTSKTIRIGNALDLYWHVAFTRLSDRHGFTSRRATQKLIENIERIRPDLIHLHNIHGYYLHIEVLFNHLRKIHTPIVWTLHDCWAFTGHCAHFEDVNCFKWKTECHRCPKTHTYPSSLLVDNSTRNYRQKKASFALTEKLFIVTPSNWLKNYVEQSFLARSEIRMIHNGIDLSVFSPNQENSVRKQLNIRHDQKIALGVASIWASHRGLDDLVHLSKTLHDDVKVVLVGLSEKQIRELPNHIHGIVRTESVDELAKLYSAADVYINPTYTDNFPTTNLEALACGTPVVTYNTGGSPEALDDKTGLVVEQGNTATLGQAVTKILSRSNEQRFTSQHCRERAVDHFNKDDRFADYLALYKELV